MDQEDTMDFKALRAKFQDVEPLLKQPRTKPALPERPKVVPPPQSTPHYLPAGARPSLLTSINQSLEGKSQVAPRVVFKDERKVGKKPLIQTNSKGKDKSEGKLKVGKDKTKGGKDNLGDESSAQKQKKENSKEKKLPLVPASPPPKAATLKRKGFLGFKKSIKRDSVEVLADPILDSTSSDVPGPAPLIPVPSDFGDSPPEAEISSPKALLPNMPTLPDSSASLEISPSSIIPAFPDFSPPPAFIPDIPDPKGPALESETPFDIETPAPSISRPSSQNEIIPSLPSSVPTPPPSHAISVPLPVTSTPSPSPSEPEIAAVPGIEAVIIAAVEKPPSPVIDPPSIPPSPKAERPISALSALERAEDMNPGKRTSPADQRILNALEKARRKNSSQLTNSTTSHSITPPPEELSPPQSPTCSLPFSLPPIDYEDRAGNALSPKPEQVNGISNRQASPVLEGINEEGSDAVPELLTIPPPPPRKVLPDPEALGPAPEMPARPPSLNPSEFIPPPPVDDNEISAPPEFSETDLPEFDDLASDAHPPEMPVSEWQNGEYTGPDTLEEQNHPEFYTNGISASGAGDEYQDYPLQESSLPISQESPPVARSEAAVGNGIYESTENVYEDIPTTATKKKGKSDGGKKRKGPPKNPYAETTQETNEEKIKTGRFGKSEKKAAAEGPDEKEQKKREKQRLEKEKKELKEKQEREKKEQKEREKKENEMKKKFKITGQEDAMYQAKVTVTTKGRKNDLPVKNGDIVSIIRTTNCPKGKWLARDSSTNYGYVAVDHVELDIKEMLELGKKAATTRKSRSSVVDGEVTSIGSRASNHYPLSAESFTDDSEEWTADDDETAPAPEPADAMAPVSHSRTLSMPDMGNKELTINHQYSHSDISPDGPHIQARHEALQKLATFFHSPKPVEPASSIPEQETRPVLVKEKAVHPPEANATQEVDFDNPDMLILPPPDLYADLTME